MTASGKVSRFSLGDPPTTANHDGGPADFPPEIGGVGLIDAGIIAVNAPAEDIMALGGLQQRGGKRLQHANGP